MAYGTQPEQQSGKVVTRDPRHLHTNAGAGNAEVPGNPAYLGQQHVYELARWKRAETRAEPHVRQEAQAAQGCIQ